MPIADYSLWSTWQQMYNVQALPERSDIRLSYHRAALFNTLFKERADIIPNLLGWTQTTHIVVLGCGFAWFVEQLIARGYTSVVGLDVSTFIQTNKSGTEEADINASITAVGLNPLVGDGAAIKARLFDGGARARTGILAEDLKSNASRTRVRQALGNRVDVVYTENLVEALTDAEINQYAPQVRQIAPVAHLITCVSDGSIPGLLNWKTLEQWKALLTPDRCIEDGTYRVL